MNLTGIIGVFTSCSQLQTVYLRRCVNITDVAIAALTEHCTHLEHLNLCGCVNVTDVSLHLLAKNCRFLQSLNISKTKVGPVDVQYEKDLKYCKYCRISTRIPGDTYRSKVFVVLIFDILIFSEYD